MTTPFQPPPGIFPAANIMLSPAAAAAFRPKAKGAFYKYWDLQYHVLYPIYDHKPEYIGRMIHVWRTPWTNEDGWAVINGYSIQDSMGAYTILDLEIPSYEAAYNYTIGTPPPFNIHTIWSHLIDWPIGPLAGAIRWGSLWLATDLNYLTHTFDIMHFDGFP